MGKRTYTYDGSEWVGLTSTTADLSNYANMTNTPISGFRNAIINGDFRINQRGITSTGVTTGGYFLDRWRMDGSTGTITASVQSFTPGNTISGYEPTQHSRIAVTGQSVTTAYASTSQKIEDVRTFAGQTITVSFWAKAASGTPRVGVEATQDFGTGGSTAVITFAGNATLSTSWQRHSVSFTVPSISGKTIGADSELQIGIWVSAGSTYDSRSGSIGIQNNTFDFWGVQVEKGTIATPFEQRPIGTELALCQRYYEVASQFYGRVLSCYDSSSAYACIEYLVPKRRIPDISITNGANASGWSAYGGGGTKTITSILVNFVFLDSWQLRVLGSFSAGQAIHLDSPASNTFFYSAEL